MAGAEKPGNTLGERIKALRKERGYSQYKLGQKLNLAESTISLYESNHRAPDIGTLKRLAEIFNVTLDFLCCRTNTRNRHIYQYEETLPYFSDQSFRQSGESYGYEQPELSRCTTKGRLIYRVGEQDCRTYGIFTGDELLVEAKPEEPLPGDLILAKLSSSQSPRFFRLVQYQDPHPTILLALDDLQNFSITRTTRENLLLFGKVIELRRSYRSRD